MSDLDAGAVGVSTSAEREALILHAVEQRRIVGLAELQEVTGASLATLRRDLSRLAEQGTLERTRGGARAIEVPSTLDEEYESRRLRKAREKTQIGHVASELVPPESLVFINDGSTMLAFAHEVAASAKELTVATSALNIAEFLAAVPTVDVLCLGGFLRHSSFGTVGPLAARSLEALTASVAFIGCDAIDPAFGVMWRSVDDAHVARVMASRSQTVVVLADSSKLGLRAPASGLSWAEVDVLVTDDAPVELRERLGHEGVKVMRP
nr:DeoR/GlpR family DNA-binding transcription regulator [Propionicimonas sp.]